jgi:hypothetical protein
MVNFPGMRARDGGRIIGHGLDATGFWGFCGSAGAKHDG